MGRRLARRTTAARASDRAFLGVSSAIFLISAISTVIWCSTVPTMPGAATIPMRMPGQSWLAASASFAGMWITMMVAMMLPSLVVMLSRYRSAAETIARTSLGRATAFAGAGYFLVWALIGLVVCGAAVALAVLQLRWPALADAIPIVSGAAVLVAGLLHFTTWRARHLAFRTKRSGVGVSLAFGHRAAWRLGLRLGLECSYGCAGPMALLLVFGLMDLRAMAAATIAVTLERAAPAGARIGRVIGLIIVGSGVFLLVRAVGP